MSGSLSGESPAPDGDTAAARLRSRVAEALAELADPADGPGEGRPQSPTAGANGDDSLAFRFGGVPCGARVAAIAAGLEMVSITCVIAWDLPDGRGLRGNLARARSRVRFGAVQEVGRDDGMVDVLMRYSFPAGELREDALHTMLVLVLADAADVRAELTGRDGIDGEEQKHGG